jgi:HD-GYP domain-containing protein (c-di-GMP phosphodiesterase class II)
MKELLARLDLHHGPGFGDHGSRVAFLSLAVGRNLGLRESESKRLWLAAFVHDVGKTQVDPTVLDKGSALGPEEVAEVRRHPDLGYRDLVDSVHSDVAEAVLCHHERWDGGGYPTGVRMKQIPLFARIIFVADAFDVMTSPRSYRTRMKASDAGEELSHSAGRQFDPAVVDAFGSLDRELLSGVRPGALSLTTWHGTPTDPVLG